MSDAKKFIKDNIYVSSKRINKGGELTSSISMFSYSGNGGYLGYSIHKAPTNNCQIFSIAAAENILGQCTAPLAKEHFEGASLFISKRLCLIDVNILHRKKLHEMFPPEAFIIEQPYRNLTGSEMIMCLIKVRD